MSDKQVSRKIDQENPQAILHSIFSAQGSKVLVISTSRGLQVCI